jgi:hypothetical protein
VPPDLLTADRNHDAEQHEEEHAADDQRHDAEQHEEEDAPDESGTPPTPFYSACSAFARLNWSRLSPEDWTLFIGSDFFSIAHSILISDNEDETNDAVVALATPLEFMTPEDWSRVQGSTPEGSLTDVLLDVVVGWGADEADEALPVISSLIRLVNEAKFSEYVFGRIREWVELLLLTGNPWNAPESLWLFLHTVGSTPFSEFFGWFSRDFLRAFLLALVNCPFGSSICPGLVQFLILVWDRDPDSNWLFIANGVPEFVARRLFISEVRDLPPISLRLLARCYPESGHCFPFPPERLFECLCWDEPHPESAFAMADLFVILKGFGWAAYLDDSVLRRLAFYLQEGSLERKQLALNFFCTLLRASRALAIPLEPFLRFGPIIYELCSDFETCDGAAYRAVCLLARAIAEAEISEADIAPFTPPDWTPLDFLEFLAKYSDDEGITWDEVSWIIAAVSNEPDLSELPECSPGPPPDGSYEE